MFQENWYFIEYHHRSFWNVNLEFLVLLSAYKCASIIIGCMSFWKLELFFRRSSERKREEAKSKIAGNIMCSCCYPEQTFMQTETERVRFHAGSWGFANLGFLTE